MLPYSIVDLNQYKPGVLFMDIGKKNSTRGEAAKRGYSVCLLGFQKKKKKNKYT